MSSQTNTQGQFMELVSSIPLITRLLLLLHILLYGYTWYNPFASGENSICYVPVIVLHEYIRILSAAFFHVGILHLAFNMMTLVAVGSYLEKKFGSIVFLGLNGLFPVLIHLLYVLVCWVVYKVNSDATYLWYCSVGYSGVLFAFVAIETRLGGTEPRSLFGMCNVPPAIYPWALLILMQFLIPNVSFLGHLCGLLIGLLYITGLLSYLTPSSVQLQKVETMLNLSRFSSFVSTPAEWLNFRGTCWEVDCSGLRERWDSWRAHLPQIPARSNQPPAYEMVDVDERQLSERNRGRGLPLPLPPSISTTVDSAV